MPKAKIGIIVDNLIASKQINDFIKLSKTSENYEVTHLIIQNSNIRRKKSKNQSSLILREMY